MPPAQGRLVALCAAGDVEAALRLLKDFPSEVNTIDSAGNTPLHAACASSVVSLPLVTALLLAGASTSAKNDDGLTPFHLACLNSSDHGQLTGHRLKRHLIFKAAVSPNQRTSRGETAAHLCATNDRHLDALRFLVGSGLDLELKAVSPSSIGGGFDGENSRAVTAREKAARCGSAKIVEFLEAIPR
jgi:ankyrin repeat protein